MQVHLCYTEVMGIEGYVTTKEAAEQLGLSPQGVYMHIWRKRIKAIKVGSTWLIPVEELDKIRNAKPGRPTQESQSDS